MRAEDVAGAAVSLGEVLVARSNTADLVGRAAMYMGEPPGAVASDLTIRIRSGEKLYPEFLSRYLSALFVTEIKHPIYHSGRRDHRFATVPVDQRLAAR